VAVGPVAVDGLLRHASAAGSARARSLPGVERSIGPLPSQNAHVLVSAPKPPAVLLVNTTGCPAIAGDGDDAMLATGGPGSPTTTGRVVAAVAPPASLTVICAENWPGAA